MLVEGIGMFLGFMSSTAKVSALAGTLNFVTDTAVKAYDFTAARAVGKVAAEVWAKHPRIKQLISSQKELAALMKEGTDYTNQEVKFSKTKCVLLHIAHKEYKVAWDDRELGEVVRLDRTISSGMGTNENFKRLKELFDRGEARFILLAQAQFSPQK